MAPDVARPVAELGQHIGAVLLAQRRRRWSQEHRHCGGPHERAGIDRQTGGSAEHVDEPTGCAEGGQLGRGRDALDDRLRAGQRLARHGDRHGRAECGSEERGDATADEPNGIDRCHGQPIGGGQEWDHGGDDTEGDVRHDEHAPPRPPIHQRACEQAEEDGREELGEKDQADRQGSLVQLPSRSPRQCQPRHQRPERGDAFADHEDPKLAMLPCSGNFRVHADAFTPAAPSASGQETAR